jgi:hypothetical protein
MDKPFDQLYLSIIANRYDVLYEGIATKLEITKEQPPLTVIMLTMQEDRTFALTTEFNLYGYIMAQT